MGLVTVHVQPVPDAAVGTRADENVSVTMIGCDSLTALEVGTEGVNVTLAVELGAITPPPLSVFVNDNEGDAVRLVTCSWLIW